MISLIQVPRTRVAALANLVPAVICLLLAVTLTVAYFTTSSQSQDPEIFIGPYLATFVFLPLGALFSLAAVAHWRRWPVRWFVQGLAIALPLVFAVLMIP